MIKLYKDGKFYKQFNGVNISNIIACQQIMRLEGIISEFPGIDLMRKCREKGFNLQGF